uniref:Uncharacterized protein n=1 Tax=Onchocerca volvulus TaxID=6282 RepID=A0A8R1XR94_ONCVO
MHKIFMSEKCLRATHETNFMNENNDGELKLTKQHLAKHEEKLLRCTICNKHPSGQVWLTIETAISVTISQLLNISNTFIVTA